MFVYFDKQNLVNIYFLSIQNNPLLAEWLGLEKCTLPTSWLQGSLALCEKIHWNLLADDSLFARLGRNA